MPWADDLLLSLAAPALAASIIPLLERIACYRSLDLPTKLASAFAVVLAYAQVGGMVLGFLGALSPATASLWMGMAALVGGMAVTSAIRTRRAPNIGTRPPAAAICFGLAGAGYLLLSTVPPWYRDSLVYHLALPRAFAMAGGFTQPDDNIFAAFPLGWESILSILHALGPPPDRFPPFNPRLLGAWTTIASALAVMGLSRSVGASERAAPWAGVLFLLIPTVLEFGTSTYVEPWLLLVTTLALIGTIRTIRGDSGYVYPVAVFGGLAASAKYPGIAVCIFIALLLLGRGLRNDEATSRRALRDALTFSLLSAFVGAPFYIRNVLQRGNPVFPLAYDIFGGIGWDSWRDIAYSITLSNYGQGRELFDFLVLPFRLFTATSMRTGFEGSLGPVIGLAFPASILLLRRGRADLRRERFSLFAFALLWSGFWAFSVQQVRFFLVGVPPLLALLTVSLERLNSGARQSAFWIAAAVSIIWVVPPALELGRRQEILPWLAGQRTEDEILTKLLPDSHPPMKELERWVPENGKVWLVWMRGYTYYLRRPYRFDSVFEAYRLEALLDDAADDRRVLDEMRSNGISHLLINERFFLVNGNADLRPGRTERIRERFERLVSIEGFRKVHAWEDVTLYEVKAAEGAAPSANAN